MTVDYQTAYNWWARYVADSEQTEREARALAARLNLHLGDVLQYIEQHTTADYANHRRDAIRAMDELRKRYAPDTR